MQRRPSPCRNARTVASNRLRTAVQQKCSRSCPTVPAMTVANVAIPMEQAWDQAVDLAVDLEEDLAVVVVGAVDSLQLNRRNLMKSISLTWLVLAAALSLGSLAHARGPSWGTGASAGTGTHTAMGSKQGYGQRAGAAQAQSGTSNGTHAQLHEPGTGLTDGDPTTGQARGAGTSRGIHTPGTGLTTTTTTTD